MILIITRTWLDWRSVCLPTNVEYTYALLISVREEIVRKLDCIRHMDTDNLVKNS